MTRNPVQIVLNTQNYVNRWSRHPGGGSTDFYAGRDEEFVRHKTELLSQLDEVVSGSSSSGDPDIVYAQVELQSTAFAKSHRPVEKVFDDKSQLYIGGNRLGSIIIELTGDEVPLIKSRVESAEEETNWVVRNGKRKAEPSRLRSEVGAIQSIRSYAASDRRKFSAERALQWLEDPGTGSSYYVETFVTPATIAKRSTQSQMARGQEALGRFESTLNALDLPIQVSIFSPDWGESALYVIHVPNSDSTYSQEELLEIHSRLLYFLDSQPIVRSIILPPVLQTTNSKGVEVEVERISVPDQDQSYPVLGVIDSGIDNTEAISSWKVGSVDLIDEAGQDMSHGTFIAGLATNAEELNPELNLAPEKCLIFDLGLHPTGTNSYSDYYPRGFLDFLEQLEVEIPAAKEAGARVFNMSLAVEAPVADDHYSIFAEQIDGIADKHDVLFVLPSGNLTQSTLRPPWPLEADDALSMLATYRHAGFDRIFQPADSIRSLVVGAMNPPDPEGSMFPAQYTRRGPGPAMGAKPDLCEVGGGVAAGSGLRSITSGGGGIEDRGTSFAAPLVARTIAKIDHLIEGSIPREALVALAVHNAKLPEELSDKKLEPLIRDFVGAGLSQGSDKTLLLEDYEITMVFNGTLFERNQMLFQFAWPPSLVGEGGKCRGDVELTLVYSPPIDRIHGGEFVRVNLDSFLRQEKINMVTSESKFLGGHLKGNKSKVNEKELIEHGAKWWPIKRQVGSFKGLGNSSQWRIVLEPLARSHFAMPIEGVPFSIILTIRDPDKSSPVFSEMRQELQSGGAVIEDIRTALSTRVRS